MVELRKRPARVEPEARPAKKVSTPTTKAETKKPGPVKKVAAAASKLKEKVTGADATEEAEEAKAGESTVKSAAKSAKTSSAPVVVGESITLEDFGGEIETHDGKKVTLKQLLEESKSGIVIFTYPKASTPGCTTQACAFRDGHETLTSTGFTIYGLSGDSPKSNTTFKTKQSLPYTLLCNPSYSLIGAIGLQQGTDKRTKRGVFAVDKSGKVLLSFAGGPIPTVDAVKKLVDEQAKSSNDN